MSKKTITQRKVGDRRRGKTDWAAFDAKTDQDIARDVAGDPDAAPINMDWSNAALIMPSPKKAVSIRLDEDVLTFFKEGGSGYQTRINEVLRSYVAHQKKQA